VKPDHLRHANTTINKRSQTYEQLRHANRACGYPSDSERSAIAGARARG
jgi:hypothetical protein